MNTANGRYQDAAFEITAGSYKPILSWIFAPGLMVIAGVIPWAASFWKYFVTIEGREYPLPFGEPVTIPVSAGHHELEFCVAGKWGGKSGRYKYQVTVAPGYVQPLLYRMGHFPAALFATFRGLMVVKKSDPQLRFSNQGYAPQQPFSSQQPMQTYGMQPPQPQQPMPHFGMQQPQPPQTAPQYASQPELTQARFDSPFTDGEQTQPPAPQFAAKKFCTQCGTAVVAGNRFCGGCGQAVAV